MRPSEKFENVTKLLLTTRTRLAVNSADNPGPRLNTGYGRDESWLKVSGQQICRRITESENDDDPSDNISTVRAAIAHLLKITSLHQHTPSPAPDHASLKNKTCGCLRCNWGLILGVWKSRLCGKGHLCGRVQMNCSIVLLTEAILEARPRLTNHHLNVKVKPFNASR